MSRIDDLIRQYAPHGVEYKALGEVGTFVRGNGLQKKDLLEDGFPAIHYGQVHTIYGVSASATRSFVSHEFAAKLRKAQPGDLVIATTSEDDDAVAKATAWLGNEPAAISGDSYIYSHSLEPKYVAYFFQSDHFQEQKKVGITGTKVRRISGERLARVRIPVPPLEIQREVVRILDSFTELEAELKAELEAELEARRQQYAHYWNLLMTPGAQWKSTTVGDVAEVFDGPHATPTKTTEGPWYLSIASLKRGWFDLDSSARLSEEDFPKWTRRLSAQPGDTLFSYETRLGEAATWTLEEPAALGRRMGALRPRPGVVDPRFLTLAYLGPEFQATIRAKTVTGATVSRIPIANMASWRISTPNLDEQRRIVAVLDRFDALVNDLSSGLPAEIEARRARYAYYRDRLLSFKEARA